MIYLWFDRLAQRLAAAVAEPANRAVAGHAHEHLRTIHHRPVATTLLTVAIALAGARGVPRLLPVSPLPQVDFPTIRSAPACPAPARRPWPLRWRRRWSASSAVSPAVTEMTSTSTLGSTGITLQFDLNRNIDAAARDVQAAINAARGYLPANLPSNPTYRKVNPADSPILILALTSEVLDKRQMYDAASTIMAQKLSQVPGVGQVQRGRQRAARPCAWN